MLQVGKGILNSDEPKRPLLAVPPSGDVNGKSGSPSYRCEDVEIDLGQGCVKRAGREEYLRQQSFQVLLYLIQRRQRLISKEELIQNFWHDTAVTDNALVQCIAEIRKALGDDRRRPRFIKTVPKVGYRFIGPVTQEPLPAKAETSAPSIDPPKGQSPEVSLGIASGLRHWLIWILAAAAAVTIGILLVYSLKLRPTPVVRPEVTLPRVPGKKPIAVTFFENQSARPDLNWLREGLADMFITDLARSNSLTVLSRQQLHLILERIGRKQSGEIGLEEALEIGRRSHAEAVLLGSFMPLGEQLVINAQLFDTNSGQVLSRDRLVVSRPGDTLNQVDLLALKLAAHLGAAPAEGSKTSGLADVMTNSLEAYRYYSLGVGKAQAFENAGAVALLRKAIQLDPKFAMAYARIGYAYSVTDFQAEKGRPYLEKAMHLSDRLTEKDRLYVTSWYAIARQDYARAIATLRQIVRQYPVEMEAHARLSRLLYREDQPEEAIAVAQQGLTADPEAKDLYNVLGIYFLGQCQYDAAIAAHRRYVQLAPSEPNSHDSLGMSYEQSGRFDAAVTEYNAALSLDPEFEPAIIHLGDVYTQRGRYHEAVKQYRRYIQVSQSDEARAVGYGSMAQVYRRKRDSRSAEEAARNETRYQKRAVWNSLLSALDRDDTATAARLQHMLVQNVPYPERGVRNERRSRDYYLGTLALRAKQPDEAITHFRDALGHLPPSSGLDLYEDCLANAYLALSHLDKAIMEYQRILHLNPNYPLAEYHLAQAYERTGATPEARGAYERFLRIWNTADADVPEIIEAKNALNRLGSVR